MCRVHPCGVAFGVRTTWPEASPNAPFGQPRYPSDAPGPPCAPAERDGTHASGATPTPDRYDEAVPDVPSFPVARIDQIPVRGVEPKSSWLLPETGSDHLPVAARISW